MNKITDINFANSIMSMMKKIFKYIPYVLLIALVSGCYEKDFSTPAQNQIDEYRTMGKMCLVNKQDSSTTNSTSSAITKNIEGNNATTDSSSTANIESSSDINQSNNLADQNTQTDSSNSDNTQGTLSANVSSDTSELNSDKENQQIDIEKSYSTEKDTPVSQVSDTKGTMFGIQNGDIIFGDPNAQVVVIEYSSPTCLHCAYYHKAILPSLKQKYIDSNRIAYLIRPFISNKQDLDAAVLSRCATNNDDYLKMVDVLYQKQDSWAYHSNYRDILTNIGNLAGISPENYQKCLNDEEISDYLINNSRAISRIPKFLGTPAFVVDGKILEQGYSEENLSDMIDKAIKKYEEKKSALSK